MVKLDEMSKLVRALIFLSATFSLVLFGVFASVYLNIYLHEMGHYVVADYYGLNPQMHIDNVVEIRENNIQVNMNPVAYVQYQNPGYSREDVMKNIYITVSGPIVNVVISLFFVITYIFIKISMMKALRNKVISTQRKLKLLRFCFFVDTLFISLIVPSIVSVIINFSNIPGSDGAHLRELLKQL